jgi:hypothetical protein
MPWQCVSAPLGCLTFCPLGLPSAWLPVRLASRPLYLVSAGPPPGRQAALKESIDCLLWIFCLGERFLGQHSLPGLVDEATGERADVVDSAASPPWEMERPFRHISGYRE